MSGGEAGLEGPDLAVGVEAELVATGRMLLGHANGERVILTRQGDEYVAVGATCTHYGGPLAEGVMDGDTVRCPWHHACFSLRTGEALRAPALSPLPCWKVEFDNGRVRVTEKIERDPLAATYPMPAREEANRSTPNRVVIVGAGAAGSAAAEMLRRCGFEGRVTIIDSDSDAPYDRPNLSKDYLAGTAPEEWIPLRPEGFHKSHGIEIVRANASRLDVAAHRLELEGKEALEYDVLLLATGAEPVRLKLPGADLPHVHYLRSLADSRAVIRASEGARRAVVIGASFIGLEVAASLRNRGLEVHVAAPEAIPLQRVMGEQIGRAIQELHEKHGVNFHLGHQAVSIDDHGVTLDDGTQLPGDLVVIGVGVRPRLSLAEDAGLELDHGVLVDERLATSAPDVYAAGDIARWPDPRGGDRIRVEHWVVAQRMGQTAARNMLGANETFDAVPFFWSAHYDVSVNYVGHAQRWDHLDVQGSARDNDVAVRFDLGGRRDALATIFRDTESLETEIAMERESAS